MYGIIYDLQQESLEEEVIEMIMSWCRDFPNLGNF